MSPPTFELIGIGNPIMDLLAHVPESFLAAHVAGEADATAIWARASPDDEVRQVTACVVARSSVTVRITRSGVAVGIHGEAATPAPIAAPA